MSKLAEFCQKVPGLRGLYNFLARVHIRGVERELRKYGLRYDDLLNEQDPDVKKALEMLPEHEKQLRAKRFIRAFDLSMKKTHLPDEIAQKEDIWNPYLRSRIELIRKEKHRNETYK
ncbi:hypothetical protein GAYE_SCF23G4243 [Galdieria yellowstonensis]|uniref:Cytochrome b-c1 complex subunit 7 n=1 Tax=Galdieria yellowstonensis TaxID=3028027 RepID=A0AAV9IFZ6_9RHOD|nr:hypothetical protein GAYE_SCF23G4243 [Galdieria yellowstonensis]